MTEQEGIYSDVQEGNTSDVMSESLDCPVCLESYDEGRRTPKMMPCLHTLCTSCIANLTCKNTKNGATPSPQDGREQEPATTTTTPTSSATAASIRNNHVSSIVNTLQSRSGHAVLRRISGHGPISPTTRQPHDPLPPTPFTFPPTSPATPTSHVSLRRPEVSPPLPPNTEPLIPKGLMVACPLCRSEVSTDKLQTNRYVLAHMRDLKRLTQISHTPEVSFVPQDFWCEDCKGPANNTCCHHELVPITKWVETQQATIESLKMAIEDQLDQHTAHLQGFEDILRDLYYTLNKTSKYIWDTKKKVKKMKDGVRTHDSAPASASPREEAERLVKEVEWLEGEAAKASRRELTEGGEEVHVSLHEDGERRLVISTRSPDLSLSITLTHGHLAIV